jgi:hypothetical protein
MHNQVRHNMLSRQAQVDRFGGHRQRGAFQPRQQHQAVPQGERNVAVGGVMDWQDSRSMWGSGNYNASMASPNAVVNASMLPNMAPLGQPGNFANPQTVIRQALVPISCISQAEAGGVEKCIQCFPDHGRLYVNGVRSGNGFFEVILTRLTAGGTDNNKLGNTFIDAGIYNSDDMFLPIDLGCANRDSPISVCFKSFNTPSDLPFLNLTFFGTRDQAHNSCDPGLALALAAGGQYMGM